jgi:methyl-accepting chemotaxis protein
MRERRRQAESQGTDPQSRSDAFCLQMRNDAMTIAQRSVGLGTLLLSILGLAVCIAVIVGVWMVKSRVEDVSNAAFEAADKSLALVNDKLGQVEEILKRGQQPVTLLSKAADRLRRQEPEANEQATLLLRQLDDAIFQELKSAQSWLESAHAIAAGVDRVFEAVVSSDYAATRQDTVGIALAERLQQSSESVSEMLDKLKSLRGEIVHLRDTAVVSRDVAARLVALVVDAEEKMNRLASGIEKLDARVAEIRVDVGDLKQRVSWWTTAAALLLTLLPVWFAVSQVVTANLGWKLMRGTR